MVLSSKGFPGDEAVYQDAIDRFNKRYPNVTVENDFTQAANWGDFINKLTARIASGDAPDIINIATEGVEYGLEKNLFESISGYIETDAGVQDLIKDTSPALLDGFSSEGEVYLIPNNWNTMVMYYNVDLFEKAGIQRPADDWTWDDFRTIAQKLTSGSGESKVYGFGTPSYLFAALPWIYSAGGSIASDDLTQPTLDSPATVKAISFLSDLVTDGITPNPVDANPTQLFQAGKVAMVASPVNLAVDLNADPNLHWDALYWPGDVSQTNVYGAQGYAIYKNSTQKDLAWELMKELGSADMQMSWATSGTSNPTTMSALESAEFKEGKPTPEVFYAGIATSKPVAAPSFYPTLNDAFLRATSLIYAGGDPQAELTKANQEVLDTVENS